jgi:hypothetical protein
MPFVPEIGPFLFLGEPSLQHKTILKSQAEVQSAIVV